MSDCATCGSLSDSEYASQKYGFSENDTQLPEAVASLRTVKDLKPGSSRADEVRQCPTCGAFFRYQSDYEYLANGSEDDQTLTRVSAEEAARLLGSG